MSWRQYQANLRKNHQFKSVPKKSNFLQVFSVMAGLVVFSLVSFYLLRGTFALVRSAFSAKENLSSSVASPYRFEKTDLRKWVTHEVIDEAPKEKRITVGNETLTLDLNFDRELHRYIRKKLKRHRVDWGGVAVIDPATGKVLALASHSEKEPQADNLALRATFPAASIFKVVTAAAAISEANMRRTTPVRFDGSYEKVSRRSVTKESGRNRMTIADAFAKSANAVFGKLGTQAVGSPALYHYASLFGFNQPIPLDTVIPFSRAEIPSNDPYQEARTAAGFGKVYLSPLHGALIASTAINQGRMMKPAIVHRAVSSTGKLEYQFEPEVWTQAMDPLTAIEMRRMMKRTVDRGTARRGFRHASRHPVLSNLDMGGKTGSLTGSNPKGKTEWFVGYARSRSRQIAIGIVLVSEKYWRIKPSTLSKDIFEYYFSPRPVLEANAGKVKTYGP